VSVIDQKTNSKTSARPRPKKGNVKVEGPSGRKTVIESGGGGGTPVVGGEGELGRFNIGNRRAADGHVDNDAKEGLDALLGDSSIVAQQND